MSSETEITPEQIDALLPFLAVFEADGFQYGEWPVPEGQFPYFSLGEGPGPSSTPCTRTTGSCRSTGRAGSPSPNSTWPHQSRLARPTPRRSYGS